MTAKKKTEDGTTKKMTGRSKILPNGAKSVEGISYDYRRERYYATVYMGKDANGKNRNASKTAKTYKEALALKKQLEEEKKKGTLQQVSRDTLVGRTEALIDYKALSLGETTIAGYRNIYKNHIAPYFKNKRIQEVTPQDLKAYITHLAKKKKLSNNSIRKHIDLLNQVFKEAFREGIITANPLARMDPIKKDRVEKKFFKPEELLEVLESVRGTQLEVPVFLASYLGLRRGEVLGLKWADVDLENRVVHIANTRTMTGSKLVEKDPKTEKSRRSVVIPEALYQVLVKEKARKFVHHDPGKPVPSKVYVAVMEDGRPINPNYLSDMFTEHIQKHKFKDVTFHGLRHTYASIANNAGAPMQEISASLGHASTSITEQIYTHDFNPVKSTAVNAVAEKLEQTKAAQEAAKSTDS